jgi:hypothetical protein
MGWYAANHPRDKVDIHWASPRTPESNHPGDKAPVAGDPRNASVPYLAASLLDAHGEDRTLPGMEDFC